MLTEDILLKMGFQRLPHFTVGNILNYYMDRRRHLSIGNVGTPNEILCICEVGEFGRDKMVTDSVCLSNYDYDGYLTEEKLKALLAVLPTDKTEKQ